MSNPNPRVTVTINDEPVTFFMSFGLLDRLIVIVNETSSVASFEMDEVARYAIMREVFLKRGKSGVFEDTNEQFNLDDFLMTTDDAVSIFDWVTEHVMDFFVKGVEKAKSTTEKMAPRIQNLKQFVSGSKD